MAKARDLTQKDLDRTCEINKEKMKAFKIKGISADMLIQSRKFPRIFVERYFNEL